MTKPDPYARSWQDDFVDEINAVCLRHGAVIALDLPAVVRRINDLIEHRISDDDLCDLSELLDAYDVAEACAYEIVRADDMPDHQDGAQWHQFADGAGDVCVNWQLVK